MKLTKSEVIDLLRAGYFELFQDEIEELSEELNTSVESITTERYGWSLVHLGNLLATRYPQKYSA